MPKINPKPKTKRLILTTSKPVVPDELCVDDGIAVAQVTTPLLASADPLPGDDRQRVLYARYIPESAGEPMRVVRVCLPFLIARHPDGRHETLDVRRQHLVQLDEGYVACAFKKLGPKKKRSRKKR